MNHSRVLSLGISGIMKEVKQQQPALTPLDRTGEKGIFYDAVMRSLKASVKFANRYADLARQMAKREENPKRAKELEEISAICSRVPENPARKKLFP